MNKWIMLCLFLGLAATGFANETDGVFSFRVGRFEVFTIVESERIQNVSTLAGADAAVLERYNSADGFRIATNAFLIKALGKTYLIDTGTGSGDVIYEKIKGLGVDPARIDAVFLTHLHGDHFGGLRRNGERAFPNAKIYVPAIDHTHFTVTNVSHASGVLELYGSNVITFQPGELGGRLRSLVTGITPIAAYGHTPGHTAFLIEDRRAQFLVIGDLLHSTDVQFPVPEINTAWDVDPSASAATRRRILEYAAANNISVGGMHIYYPGIGNVSRDGTGFKFTPAE